jgi:hypothetical protein
MSSLALTKKQPRQWRSLYPSKPLDSIVLAEEAQALFERSGAVDVRRLLAQIPTDRPELATMLLYQACRMGANGAFLNELERLPAGPAPLQGPLRILIVPGFLFAEHPELALDGKLIQGIAERLGASAEVLDINSRGTCDANGQTIAQRLSNTDVRDRVWMFSVSKGTADARAALYQLGGWPAGLAGWIDVSGIFSGSPIADWWSEDLVRRWLLRTFFGLNNLPFAALLEMRRDAPIWQQSVIPPTPDRLIHILGFPPPWRVEPRMVQNYRRLLATHGPNDGFTPLCEALGYPGRIYPIWGADHLMRLPDLATVIYRLIHLAACIENSKAAAA